MKRTNQKILTKEAKILKFMRHTRGLSMRQTAALIGVSEGSINHIENGRIDITELWINRLLITYQYTPDDFNSYLIGSKNLPDDTLECCIDILKSLNPEKVKAIHGILISFSST